MTEHHGEGWLVQALSLSMSIGCSQEEAEGPEGRFGGCLACCGSAEFAQKDDMEELPFMFPCLPARASGCVSEGLGSLLQCCEDLE